MPTLRELRQGVSGILPNTNAPSGDSDLITGTVTEGTNESFTDPLLLLDAAAYKGAEVTFHTSKSESVTRRVDRFNPAESTCHFKPALDVSAKGLGYELRNFNSQGWSRAIIERHLREAWGEVETNFIQENAIHYTALATTPGRNTLLTDMGDLVAIHAIEYLDNTLLFRNKGTVSQTKSLAAETILQEVEIPSSDWCAAIAVQLYREGNPTGELTLTVNENDVAIEAASVKVTAVPKGDRGWVYFFFNTPILFDSSNRYTIGVAPTDTLAAQNDIHWFADANGEVSFSAIPEGQSWVRYKPTQWRISGKGIVMRSVWGYSSLPLRIRGYSRLPELEDDASEIVNQQVATFLRERAASECLRTRKDHQELYPHLSQRADVAKINAMTRLRPNTRRLEL